MADSTSTDASPATPATKTAAFLDPRARYLDAALAYAKLLGWPVFPLQAVGNKPRFPTAHPKGDPLRGKCRGECGQPGHGFWDATTDPELIKTWWYRHGGSNIGVATGGRLRLLVIDLDGEEGMASWIALEQQHGDIPDGPKVKSPHGWHLYFLLPEGVDVRISQGKIAVKVDVRASGGYITVPISQRVGGNYYWLPEHSPLDMPIPEAPAWLLDLIQQRSPAAKVITRRADAIVDVHLGKDTGILRGIPAVIGEGVRNGTLAKIAGRLRVKGYSADQMFPALLAVNDERCDPPLDEWEVEQVAVSIGRYEPGPPPPEPSFELQRRLDRMANCAKLWLIQKRRDGSSRRFTPMTCGDAACPNCIELIKKREWRRMNHAIVGWILYFPRNDKYQVNKLRFRLDRLGAKPAWYYAVKANDALYLFLPRLKCADATFRRHFLELGFVEYASQPTDDQVIQAWDAAFVKEDHPLLKEERKILCSTKLEQRVNTDAGYDPTTDNRKLPLPEQPEDAPPEQPDEGPWVYEATLTRIGMERYRQGLLFLGYQCWLREDGVQEYTPPLGVVHSKREITLACIAAQRAEEAAA